MTPQTTIILFALYFIMVLQYSYSYNSCQNCRYFISHSKNIDDLGLCSIFKGNFAKHCRNDENLCGEIGHLYENKLEITDNILEQDLMEMYEELNNRCSGEVNEKDELEKLEKDFTDIYIRIKKHNKNIRKPFYKR